MHNRRECILILFRPIILSEPLFHLISRFPDKENSPDYFSYIQECIPWFYTGDLDLYVHSEVSRTFGSALEF